MIITNKAGVKAKMAYGTLVEQMSTDKIIENLPLNPEQSKMEILLLIAKDVTGLGSGKLLKALGTMNDEVKLVYLYSKEKEAYIIPEAANIFAYQVNDYTPQTIKGCVDKVLKKKVNFNKKVTEITAEEKEILSEQVAEEYVPEPQPEATQVQEFVEEQIPEHKEEPIQEQPQAVVDEPSVEPEPVEEIQPNIEQEPNYDQPRVPTIEDRLNNLASFGNFDLLKQEMQKEVIIQEAMRDSSLLAGAMDTLAICEKKFFTILQDRTLTTDERLKALHETATLKTEKAAQVNNVLVERLSSIIKTAIRTAENAVNDKLETLNKTRELEDATEEYFRSSHELHRLQRNRLDIQLTIAETIQTMIKTYQVLSSEVTNTVIHFDDGLPSENETINELLTLYKDEFTTDKTLALAHKLQAAIQEGALKFSAIEKESKVLIESLANLCEVDDKVITYQDKLIQILSGKSVKDIVVRTHSIQNALQVFIGGAEAGVTTTAVLQSKLQSKVGRTLCIDFRPAEDKKFEQYGLDVMPLKEFLLSEYVRDLQFLSYDLGDDIEYLDEVINHLTLKLVDYRFINFIFSNEQLEAFHRIEDKTLAVHIIVNSNVKNIVIAKDLADSIKSNNIARILCMINPTIEPISMAQKIVADPLMWKIVQFPYLNEINRCSIEGHAPFDSTVLETYRVALR